MLVEDVTVADRTAADGIIAGSPTRFGGGDWQMKHPFDVISHEAYPGPLERGMIVQGEPYGPH